MRMPHFLQIFLSSVHALMNTYFVINSKSSALMLKPLTVVTHYKPVSKGCGEKKIIPGSYFGTVTACYQEEESWLFHFRRVMSGWCDIDTDMARSVKNGSRYHTMVAGD